MGGQYDIGGKERVLAEPVASGDEPISIETLFETLSSRRRRFVLHYLAQVNDQVTIRDLAEQVAAWENDVERDVVTPKERKRVYTGLLQTHLPKMHRLGIVEYDTHRGTITRTDRVDEFDIYLDVVPKDDLPWSEFYLALGSVLTALVTVATLGFWPFSTVDGTWYALFVALMFTVVGAVHTVRGRRRVVGSTGTSPEVTPPPEVVKE